MTRVCKEPFANFNIASAIVLSRPIESMNAAKHFRSLPNKQQIDRIDKVQYLTTITNIIQYLNDH